MQNALPLSDETGIAPALTSSRVLLRAFPVVFVKAGAMRRPKEYAHYKERSSVNTNSLLMAEMLEKSRRQIKLK